MPECDIFKQLRNNLEIEHNATKSSLQNWDAFNVFMDKAKMDILPDNTTILDKKVAAQIKELLDKTDCVFDWDKIATVPDDLPDENIREWEIEIWSNKATLQSRLTYLKYKFEKKFYHRDEIDSKLLNWYDFAKSLLWSKFITLPDKMRSLFFNNQHIMNRLFRENLDSNYHERMKNADRAPNGLNYDVDGKQYAALDDFFFPQVMRTAISLKEINDVFRFHNPARDYRNNLVANMINSYFGGVYYKLQGRKYGQGERVYTYETDSDFALAFASAYRFVQPKYKPIGEIQEDLGFCYDSDSSDSSEDED